MMMLVCALSAAWRRGLKVQFSRDHVHDPVILVQLLPSLHRFLASLEKKRITMISSAWWLRTSTKLTGKNQPVNLGYRQLLS